MYSMIHLLKKVENLMSLFFNDFLDFNELCSDGSTIYQAHKDGEV
jgi:hypothetical protein